MLNAARRGKVLEELDIPGTRARRAFGGGLVLQVRGPHGSDKARKLADSLRAIVGKDARVACPVRKGQLRLSQMDDSVVADDVRTAIARATGWKTLEDIGVGRIITARGGLGSTIVNCPLTAIRTLLRRGPTLQIGFSEVRLEYREPGPVRCIRCWGYGHLARTCGAREDRRTACFRCGSEGHLARDCTRSPKCVPCGVLGLPTGHRTGALTCGARQAAATAMPGRPDGPHQQRQQPEDRLQQQRQQQRLLQPDVAGDEGRLECRPQQQQQQQQQQRPDDEGRLEHRQQPQQQRNQQQRQSDDEGRLERRPQQQPLPRCRVAMHAMSESPMTIVDSDDDSDEGVPEPV